MDDHELHLVDQSALDLRHNDGGFLRLSYSEMLDIASHYVDGDRYTSAALHCMHFLSNPPKCSGSDHSPEIDIMYLEWRKPCSMALHMLCELLPQANTSPELVEYISNHDINSAVRQNFSVMRVWEMDVHILAFLSRACVCVNWRIVSAIQRGPITTDDWLSKPEKRNAKSDEREDRDMTRRLIEERLDQCCND